jgi:hypothetical protein
LDDQIDDIVADLQQDKEINKYNVYLENLEKIENLDIESYLKNYEKIYNEFDHGHLVHIKLIFTNRKEKEFIEKNRE